MGHLVQRMWGDYLFWNNYGRNGAQKKDVDQQRERKESKQGTYL